MSVVNLGKILPTVHDKVLEGSSDLVSSKGIYEALTKKLSIVDGSVSDNIRFTGSMAFSTHGMLPVSRKGYYAQAIQIEDSSTVIMAVGTVGKTIDEINSTGIAQTFDSSFNSGFENYIGHYVCIDTGKYFPDCAKILSVDGNKLTLRPVYTFWNEDKESAYYPLFGLTCSISLSVPETLDANLEWINSINSVGIDLKDTVTWCFGDVSYATGNGSISIGRNNYTTGSFAASIGEGIYNPFNGCVMVGRYPLHYTDRDGYDPIFVVGDGIPGTRHSALVIRRGLMEINIDPTRIYLGDITLAQYVTDNTSTEIAKVPASQCDDASSIESALNGFGKALDENSSTAEIVAAINELRVVLKNVVTRMYE